MKEATHGYLAILVVKTQKGDMAAFSELYALSYDKVYNYACHYLKDSYLAQDAVQEIYIIALKKIETLNDPLLFTAWLNQISFRVCFDMCKRKDSSYDTISDELLSLLHDNHPTSNPETQVELNEEQTQLRKALDTLPYLQRSIIVMRFFNDMRLNDIADAMEISLSSVKRYLEQAKVSLHRALSST